MSFLGVLEIAYFDLLKISFKFAVFAKKAPKNEIIY